MRNQLSINWQASQNAVPQNVYSLAHILNSMWKVDWGVNIVVQVCLYLTKHKKFPEKAVSFGKQERQTKEK